MRSAMLTLALALLLAGCGAGGAETLAFPRREIVSGRMLALSGRLWLPPGEARVPAVVLSHGSSGLSPSREPRYAAELLEMGVAVLAVDHFGPRGITSTVADQSQVSELAMLLDAFAALDALARHPRIRADRIGIAGFSKGGGVTWRAALERFNAPRGPGAARFALHVAFYPGCRVRYLNLATTGAPLRFLLGERDSYTGAAPCVDLAGAIRAAGGEAEAVVYPGAAHGFDGYGADWSNRAGENTMACSWTELPGRRWRENASGMDYAETDTATARAAWSRCVTHGVSGGPDPAARAASLARLKQEVALHLLR